MVSLPLPWWATRWISLSAVALLVTSALLASGVSDIAQPATSAPTKPVLSVPPLSTASADSCAPLTVQWMQTKTVGSVQVAVTYLDPTVALACIKAAYPDAASQQVQVNKQLAGFPSTLRVSLRLQAADQDQLAPRDWHVTLSAGRAVSAATSHTVTEQPDLVTQGTGTAYQETIVYTFANPGDDLLPPKAAVLAANVSGPPGKASLDWNFSGKPLASSHRSDSEIGYIPILSWVVVAIGVLLVIALWLTRPVVKHDPS